LIAEATERRCAREKETVQDPRAELKTYLSEILLCIDENLLPESQAELILSWWKVLFLVIILVASPLIFFPIQGSSVPACERALSDAGLTDAKRCARLLPKNLGDIQTLKGSFKVFAGL
ncbi:hypothetical protein AZE42_14000, partial [Rhizopogon vesiculosus]